MKRQVETFSQPLIVGWKSWSGHGRTIPSMLAVHAHVEIQLVRKGHGQYLISGHPYPFQNDTLALIPSNTPHLFKQEPFDRGEKWLVLFHPSLLRTSRQTRRPQLEPRVLQLDKTAFEEIESLLRLLHSESARHQCGRVECITAGLNYLLALVDRAGHGQKQLPPRNQAITGIIACIEKGYLENLTLASLAVETGYSPYYLAHIFKRCTGMSIRQYILQRRVAQARRLLAEEPALTVATVAERVGFGGYRGFCHAFRKFVGINSAAYRRSCSELTEQDALPDHLPNKRDPGSSETAHSKN